MFEEILIAVSSILLRLYSHTSLIVLLAFVPGFSLNVYYKPVDVEDKDHPSLLVSLAPSKMYGTMVKTKP